MSDSSPEDQIRTELYGVTARGTRRRDVEGADGGSVGSTPTTKWQVGGHRFLLRRIEHALVRRDVRMLDDPMRARSRALVAGAALAAVGLAGSAVLAFLRPVGSIGDASIVVGADSGAMYVVDDGTVHPVTGLSSARLVLGRADRPVTVSEKSLTTRPRGPLVGITGAPDTVPVAPAPMQRTWSVCDTGSGAASGVTTVVISDSPAAEPFRAGEAALWTRSGRTYLVYGGVRAAIDPTDVAVTRALGIDGARTREVAAGVLDALPEVPALNAPVVPGAGEATTYDLARDAAEPYTVGSVVAVDMGGRTQHYVALRDGVQPVSTATAQLLRFADSQGSVAADVLTPDALTAAPRTRSPLPVETFPDAMPILRDDAPVACVSRVGTDVTISSGSAVIGPPGVRPVVPVAADGPGDGVDAVMMAPGIGEFVAALGPTAPGPAASAGAQFYVADTGVRFGVADADSARALDLPAPTAAPWSIVRLLPAGPALSREGARVAHDGVNADRAGASMPGG